MLKRALLCAALLFGGAAVSNATLIIRELWDTVGTDNNNPPGLASYNDGISSLGFKAGVNWQNHPAVTSNALIQVAQNFDVPPGLGLPVNFNGQNAGIWSDVFWGGGDANAAIPYNSSSNWSGRLLETNAWINFSQNGTYYFSLDLGVAGSGAGGMAIASDLTGTNKFVGFGVSWPTGFYPLTNGGDAGSSLYVCQGSFGDPVDPNTSSFDAQGLYAVKAYGNSNLMVSGNYLLVGQLTTTTGGSATLKLKAYATGVTGIETLIPNSAGSVVWDATYSFSETNVMKYLVVFMNTEAPSYPYDTQGGLRVATTWGEAVGVEALNLSVSPSTTVFAGQTVTFNSRIRLNNADTNNNDSGPVGYYYTKGGVQLSDPAASGVPGGAGSVNVSYTLTTSSTGDTGDYAVVATNKYGSAASPAIHITVLPSAGPSFLVQPQLPASRYAGAGVLLQPQVQGTPPFTYQWFHGTTSLTGQTNLNLNLSNLSTGDQGNYYLHVSNFIGSTNSVTNALTILPTSGYVKAVVANNPFAHYELEETSPGPNTVLHDFVGGNDGVAIDTNVVLGLPGPPYVGFDATDFGMGSARNAPDGSRINVPIFNYSSNMTICAWVYGNGMNNGVVLGSDGTGYGIEADGSQYFGLYFPSGNTLGSHWGASTTAFNSGLVVPSNQWTFVSLVITPSTTTIYVGENPTTLAASTQTAIVNGGNTVPIDGINGTCVGRTDYSWAGPGNAWAGCFGNFSQVSFFYSALSPQAVTNLYASGVGVQISGASDGAGNLTLNWLLGGTLQESTDVRGTYTDILSATPPYSVPMTNSQKFYRIKR